MAGQGSYHHRQGAAAAPRREMELSAWRTWGRKLQGAGLWYPEPLFPLQAF